MIEFVSTFIIYLISGFILNHAVTINKIIKIPSYLVSIFFLILSLPLMHIENALLIAISIFLFTLYYIEIINLYDSLNSKKNVFKAGFITGAMTIIDYHFIYYKKGQKKE